MALFYECSLKIVWLIMQVILNLISPYTTLLQYRSYASTIDHFPRLHPSKNPDCPFRSAEAGLHDRVLNYQESFMIDHEPSIEIRAVLVPCPRSYEKRFEESLSNFNKTFHKDSVAFNDHETIRNCRQKLIVTLKLTNVGKIRTEDEYIVVSHALDPITMQKSRLHNPYVIKIRREPVLQLYGLKFERIVNAEAREQIIIKKRSNYVGCNDGTENPTCGLVFNNGVPVPFSQGFCCSCGNAANATRQPKESKKWTGNLSSKVETNRDASANKSSNRSESRGTYERRSFDDSKLSAVARRTNGIKRKRGHFVYNSRKLKENTVGNNVSTIGNIDNELNDREEAIQNDTSMPNIRRNIRKNSNIKRTARFADRNDDGFDNTTTPLLRTILFSAKMQTKGKIEPYMDAIQEQALRESRDLEDIESRTSSNQEPFVLESPLTSKNSCLKNCKKKRTRKRRKRRKKRKKYENDDRIVDVEQLGRKNLMDELTELEMAYDALKKMRRSGTMNRNSKKDESCSRIPKDLAGKAHEYEDNIEKNAKKRLLTKIDERKMERDAEVNENRIEESQRCFRMRKKEKEKTRIKRKKKKKDKGYSNSVKSMGTFTSRLDDFQARSSHDPDGEKIYEDQSSDIEVPKKMEFAKYLLSGNASISGISGRTGSNDDVVVVVGNETTFDNTPSSFSLDSKIKKCNGSTIESSSSSLDSREGGVFELLTRLLVPDEEISKNLEMFVGNPLIDKYSNSFIEVDKEDNSKEIAFKRGTSNLTTLESPMKRKKKQSSRNKKQNSFSPSPNSENLIKITENRSRETTDRPRNIRVYVQRPSFDFVSDKNLNELSNSTDNPFLMDENARRNSVDRRIEEKFGRITEVLKEASEEAIDFPISMGNESTTITNDDANGFNYMDNNKTMKHFNISENNEENYPLESNKGINHCNGTGGIPKIQINFITIGKNSEHFNDTKNASKIQIHFPQGSKRLNNFNTRKISPKLKIDNPESSNGRLEDLKISKNIEKIQKYLNIAENDLENSGIENPNVSKNFANAEPNENGAGKIEGIEISLDNVPTTNFSTEFKVGGTRPKEKVIPRDKSSFSSNPVNGAERYTNERRRPNESVDRINVGTSKNGSKQISDLIISRTHLNGTIVVVADGSAVGNDTLGRDGVSYLDLENSGFALRQINSSNGSKPLLYKIKQRRKTFGRTRLVNRTDADVTTKFDRWNLKNDNSIFNNGEQLINKENDVKETKREKPHETIFYEYDEGESDYDDYYDDSRNSGRKARRLLSIVVDVAKNVENEDEGGSFDDEDSENLEYEDYIYSRTDSSNNQNVGDMINQVYNVNSMGSSKRKTRMDRKHHGNLNKNIHSKYSRNGNADKYIKQMSGAIAHRDHVHGTKHNKYKNKDIDKMISTKSKIVKKQVNEVPMYDLIPSQETFNAARNVENINVENINPEKNDNYIPVDSGIETNLDDPANYDQNFEQNREKKEKLSSIDTQNPSTYNNEDDFKCPNTKSSKMLDDTSMVEKQNELPLNPEKKSDDDIDISVNGNIHVQGGMKGPPISIAFVALPETNSESSSVSNDSSLDVSKSDDTTNGIVKLNEIPINEANDQDDSVTNVESIPIISTDDLDKGEGETDSFIVNNNDNGESLERNRSTFSGEKDRFYSEGYKYSDMEKSHDDRMIPPRESFVFNQKVDDDDAKDFIPNENLEISVVEENADDSENAEDDLENLTREKKEVEKNFDEDEPTADEISNSIETSNNDSLPNGDNVTLLKIIPEKLFDDIPSDMKNDFSNNFQLNSYGDNLSSFEFPFLSNPTPMGLDSAIYLENSADTVPSSINFPVIFETTVQPNDNFQESNKNVTSPEMTTLSKITEPDVVYQKVTTPPRLSISNTEASFSKQTDQRANSTQIEKNDRKAEKSRVLNETSSTTESSDKGDSCFKMKVTVKKLNESETTTNAPTTTTKNVQATTMRNNYQENRSVESSSADQNSSQAQTSRIRERNASAIANFIKELQALAPSNAASSDQSKNEGDKSLSSIKEVVIVPDDSFESNQTKSDDISDSKFNCDENTDERVQSKSELNNINPESHIDDGIIDSNIRASMPVSSSSNDSLENSPIPVEDLPIQETIPENNSKFLSSDSKKPFNPNSLDTSGNGDQQQSGLPCGSSTKRSLADDSDTSFLFYTRPKQLASVPESLVKTKEVRDIDVNQRTNRRQVFVSRNKRNEMVEENFQSLNEKTKEIDDVSLEPWSNVQEKVKSEVYLKTPKQLNKRKKSTEDITRRGSRFDKRKVEKRKKKMNPEKVRKLTGIRRRKKKKKRKKKMKKLDNPEENTLDIPEIRTKWRLVKRNLLSVDNTENLVIAKRRDRDDLKITRKGYEKLDRSGMDRISREDVRSWKERIKEMKKVDDAGPTLIRRRQSGTDGKQVRGGQDCSNRDQPVDVDESKYSESAHCLRFSDLWYSVYRLEGPILDHGVSVQLYEKRSLPDGTARWEDLTPSMIRLNTFSRRYRNNDDSLAFTYRAKREPSKQFPASLNVLEDRLLVPSSVSSGKAFKVAESKGAFEEYLIVRASEISANGNECDKIGVGFKAFVEQPDRCGRLEGTCLTNQPLSYWKRDREAREAGRAGCYFLSNFASVPSEPIKYNVSGSGSGEFLALEYHSPHVSAIDIEVRNDYNGVASAGPVGRISHIYVDSTSPVHTLVTIVIRNVGSTPTVYRPRIVDCPRGLPVSWSNARGIVQMILPRQNGRVAFDLYGELPFNEFECTVELLDRAGKTVATRRMKVRRMDRCFCVWHCLCACVGDADGSTCRPMSTTHYRAAGFLPPVPATPIESSSSFMGSLLDVTLFFLSLMALLIAMGISKWIIGFYVPAVSRWGLDTLLESARMSEYFEEELKCRCIVRDESGWPVHPDTGSRSIRICSRKTEFFLNATFFLTYPVIVFWQRMRKFILWSRRGSSSTSNDESKACLSSDRDEYQNLVTVSTYGDCRNSKMEAEDTDYVMNELKKSQESLQEYNRYKRFRYYMDSQDSRYLTMK